MPTAMSLSELLNAKCDEYRYLLLDPLKSVPSWNALHLNRLNDVFGNDALYRVLRPDLAYAPQYCPVVMLLALPGILCNEELLLKSEEYSRDEKLYEKRYICGWISSPLAPEAFAAELAGLCKQVQRENIVPFYEPLRLELLTALNGKNEFSRLISNISQWCWISCSGRMQVLSGTTEGDEWRMKWGTECAQNNVRDIWRLLSAWHKTGGSLPADAAKQAADAWAKSELARLPHKADTVCLALSYLTLPDNITAHPEVLALLEQVASHSDLYLTRLFPTLSDALLQTLIGP